MPSFTKEFFLARARELKQEYNCLEGTKQDFNKENVVRRLQFIEGLIDVNLSLARICA